jgi:outer membrane lipoprotein carrier protein
MPMIRILICALLAAIVPRASLAAQELDAIVRKVQERYDATRDFTADVTQEMTIVSLGKTTTAHGTVAFKRPGKMRWDLSQGEQQVIVADGETLWLYQPSEKQVLKAPFDAAFRATTPISFLTGVGKIAQDFEVSVDPEDDKRSAEMHLLLVPRRDSSGVGKLRLTVARDSGEIRGAEIRDPFGNVSRLHFEHMQRNVGLKDDQFAFQVPPGVDVISAPIGQ